MRNYMTKLRHLAVTTALTVCVMVSSPHQATAELDGERAGYEGDLIELLCADGGVWLECYYHSPSRCRQVVRPLVHTCVERHLADLKSEITMQTALERNVDILGCFNTEFPKTIGAKRKDEKRCLEQPNHLK